MAPASRRTALGEGAALRGTFVGCWAFLTAELVGGSWLWLAASRIAPAIEAEHPWFPTVAVQSLIVVLIAATAAALASRGTRALIRYSGRTGDFGQPPDLTIHLPASIAVLRWVTIAVAMGFGMASAREMLEPASLYMVPLLAVFSAGKGLLVALALFLASFACRILLRRHSGVAEDWWQWRMAWIGIIGVHALAASTLPFHVRALASIPALDAALARMERGEELEGQEVGSFSFERLGRPADAGGRADTIVFELTDPTVAGGRFPGSGSGFLHLSPGQEIPAFNAGETGPLLHGWWWYNTD